MIQPNKHHRRSIRIPGYDYAEPGAYFITVCAFNKALLFGEISEGEMHLNAEGLIVAEEWVRTERVRPNLSLDEYVVMPNHLHAIVIVDHDVGATRWVAHENRQTPGPSPDSIGAIVGQFKSVSTKRINARANTPGNRVWQRNYYEHVIPDEGDPPGRPYGRGQWS